MNDKIRLEQVFYGSGTFGYGILATSIADKKLANVAINACLAIGQVPGSGLRAPVFLSRVLGDHIVMARLCNGARDPSGRNTLFVHALVGLKQEVRDAGVTTFTLADVGVFRDSLSGDCAEAIEVAANPPTTQPPSASLELPAAIEAANHNETLMRRIVAGRENELSWATFALEDMPGYDVICISNNASRPSARAIYDSDLRLLRHRLDSDKLDNGGVRLETVPTGTVEDTSRSLPPLRDVCSSNGIERNNNKTFVALLVSIALNLVLLAIVFRMLPGETKDVRSVRASDASLERGARVRFTDDKRVTDEELKGSAFPLGSFAKETDEVKKEWPEQLELFRKLIAYRNFVEEEVLKRKKEK